MRILFIYPPMNRISIVPSNYEPLAFEILAATVPQHSTDFIDMRYENSSALIRTIAEYKPDVVGVTVNNTIDVYKAQQSIRRVREKDPHTKIVVGGKHVSLVPSDFYLPEIDAIFVGWADRSFPRYISAVAASSNDTELPGVISVREGRPIFPRILFDDIGSSDIPTPDRSLSRKYWSRYRDDRGLRLVLVNTTRGCPYRCTFCACWKSVHGRYFARSAESVFLELRQVPSGVRYVSFSDDNSFTDVSRAEHLYSLIKTAGLRQKYSAFCRSDTIARSPDLIRAWREIGLWNLVVGFESIDTDGLHAYNKHNAECNNREAARILNDLGIEYGAHFIVRPDFRRGDFARLLCYVQDLRIAKPRFVVLTPLPGTDLYKDAKPYISRDYEYFDFLHCVYPPKLSETTFVGQVIRLFIRTNSFRGFFSSLGRMLFGTKSLYGRSYANVSFALLARRWMLGLPIILKLRRHSVLAAKGPNRRLSADPR